MLEKTRNWFHSIHLTVLVDLATLTLMPKPWVDVRPCCNLGHGIACPSLQQELIGHHRIHWL